MSKLTLSVDPRVVQGAKRYARGRGTSVSKLVEGMLRLVAAQPTGPARRDGPAQPPVLGLLRGSLKRGDARTYHRHLERKYR